MSNFWKRTLTGAVFVIVMLSGIMWNYWSLCALFFLIAMLGLNEFYNNLLKHSNIHPQRWVGMIVGALVFLLFAFRYELFGESIFIMIVPFIVAIFFIELLRNKENPFVNIAVTITGIFYVVLPFALWVSYLCPYTSFHNTFINQLANTFIPAVYNPHLLSGYFFIMWTNDTGAYIVGRTMGKHKFWERISPHKTWEGFIGGIVLSVAVAYLISHFYTDFSALLWMILGVIISISGTLGDLVESLFKRSIDVKESGGLLPGHGGILDRFDSVLLSTPIVLALVQMAGYVSVLINN